MVRGCQECAGPGSILADRMETPSDLVVPMPQAILQASSKVAPLAAAPRVIGTVIPGLPSASLRPSLLSCCEVTVPLSMPELDS